MKITYPECQIEITAEELILLIDRINLNNAGVQLVQEIERIKDDLTEQPEPKPYPAQEEPAPTDSKKEPAPTKRKTNSKKVQVLFETGWKTFNSISQAAKAVDARLNHLSHALLNGKTCNGHQVRYATDNNEPTQPANEEQTELP